MAKRARAKAAYNRAWRRTPRGVFLDQQQNARRRGIEWLMTFDEWWDLWETKFHMRGRRSHQYCMARNGDNGPYAVGNARVITGRENREETAGRSKKGWDRWRARRDKEKGHEMANA